MISSWWRRNRWATVSVVGLLVLSIGFVAYAVTSRGAPVQNVSLNDGGVWVTSNQNLRFGRLNVPAGSIDAPISAPSAARNVKGLLDVRQEGAAVVAWDQVEGRLYPIDVVGASLSKEQGVVVPKDFQVGLAGGSLAVLDPGTGKLWAQRVDDVAGVGSLEVASSGRRPIARLPQGDRSVTAPAVTVGVDGSVVAAAASGRVWRVTPDDDGFSEPKRSRTEGSYDAVQATMVGGRLVLLDPERAVLTLPGGKRVPIPDGEGSRLQESSPDGPEVVVATQSKLHAVDLGSGEIRTLFDGRLASGPSPAVIAGEPAAPTWFGNCVHAAWAAGTTTPGAYLSSCDGDKARPQDVKDEQSLRRPVFRVNRDSIVLNDLETGLVLDLQTGRRVDNWEAVVPPVTTEVDCGADCRKEANPIDRPPKAVDDQLGARPGRTSVLHVLDNDSDPQGYVLVVSSVANLDDPAASATIAPDGQSVLLAMPPGSGTIRFQYTIDNGRGLSATANATVQARAPTENSPPNLRPGTQPGRWSSLAQGALSISVLGDWRDPDSDPPALASVKSTGGTAATTSEGRISFLAPPEPGPVTLTYQVSDGFPGATAASGTVAVDVIDPAGTQRVAPRAEADVARGTVGERVELRPLANDVPGVDPANPGATLAIAGQIISPDGATVETDLTSGTATILAARAGTFFLSYQAAFGSAPSSNPGSIRVDIADQLGSGTRPVAMPDNAVLRAQAPALLDVLANDISPSGRLLVVTRASPETPNGQLQITVVDGRYVRVNALAADLAPNPQLVNYTITDGQTEEVTGQILVTQLAGVVDVPIPEDDVAYVRSGDVVSVSVLDNDLSPSGEPLALAATELPNDGLAPGELAVRPLADMKDRGQAFISGNLVRYVAPPGLTGQQSVVVEYLARNPAGEQATGRLRITIVPAPSSASANRPPEPQRVDARVTAGDRIVISVPTFGIDPDGDSVTVVGLGSGPRQGRVGAVNSGSIAYDAFPTGRGTDTFTYRVEDTFGATGEASIRVAVVPPARPLPPVAVADEVTATPGGTVTVGVLGNDVLEADAPVTIAPGGAKGARWPAGVKLVSPTGPIQVTAPSDPKGPPLTFAYSVSNGVDLPSLATVTVRARDGFDNPPVVSDVVARARSGSKTARADVLREAYDPEGSKLEVLPPPGARVRDGVLLIPVKQRAQVLPFRVTDGTGFAMGVVRVPARTEGDPFVQPGAVIKVGKDSRETIDVTDYVIDPAGRRITVSAPDQVSAAPPDTVQVTSAGAAELTLTTSGGYEGPGSVTFEVSAAGSGTDQAPRRAVVSIPVQVGREARIVGCPADPIPAVEGGAPVSIDVVSVCNVWVPKKKMLDQIAFEATWARRVDKVAIEATGARTVAFRAAAGAVPETTGDLSIRVTGSSAPPTKLPFKVVAAPPPTLNPVVRDGFVVGGGRSATIDLAEYMQSPLRDAEVTVARVEQIEGANTPARSEGSVVTISPSGNTSGVLRYRVTAADVADPDRSDRYATSTITISLLNVPEAPTNVTAGRTVLSRTVELSWTTPPSNGSPIIYYQVTWAGGSQQCAASPCSIVNLQNGVQYAFTVVAHNAVGPGLPSAPPVTARPDAVPEAVTNLTVATPRESPDGRLTISWTAARVDGTPIVNYEVAWDGRSQLVPGSSTSFLATGLLNTREYSFTVTAINELGRGPSAIAQGQSSGKPDPPKLLTGVVDAASRSVTLNWEKPNVNGREPVQYLVTRGQSEICAWRTSTTCTDRNRFELDGATIQYQVYARNTPLGYGENDDRPLHTSVASPYTFVAATTPGPVTAEAIALLEDWKIGLAKVKVTLGDANGPDAEVRVSCTPECGSGTQTTKLDRPGEREREIVVQLSQMTGYWGDLKVEYCNAAGSRIDNAPACSSTIVSVKTNAPLSFKPTCVTGDGTVGIAWTEPSAPFGSRKLKAMQITAAGGAPVSLDKETRSYFVDATDAVDFVLTASDGVDDYPIAKRCDASLDVAIFPVKPPSSGAVPPGVGSCASPDQRGPGCVWIEVIVTGGSSNTYQVVCAVNSATTSPVSVTRGVRKAVCAVPTGSVGTVTVGGKTFQFTVIPPP